MAMSYRTIALASCLFVVACGSAPSQSQAPRSPASEASASASGQVTSDDKLVKKPDESAATVTAPSASPVQGAPPLHGTSAADSGSREGRKEVGQAVVAPPEPLSGKLTQADIGRILESNGDVFGDCYTLGAGGKTKDFKGIVTVKATIGPSGVVNQVDVTKSTANNPKVDACVREAFKKIKFPHPRDGATSVITFPISFNGVEQIQ